MAATLAQVVAVVENEATAMERFEQRVDAAEIVLEVTCVYVRYLSNINTIDQSFSIAVDYDFEWAATKTDFEEWEKGPEAQKQYTPEIVPSFVFPNAKVCEIIRAPQANGNPYKLDVESGKNCFRALVESTSIVLYDIHSFPFDCQSLDVKMEMTFKNADQMIFVPSKKDDSQDLMVWNTNFSASPDFQFKRGLLEFGVRDNINFAYVILRLQVVRKPYGYLFRVALPLCLLSLVSVVAFSFDLADGFGDRVSYLITLVLTFVAFAFVLNQELPQVPYLTVLDKYNTTCFTLVNLLLVTVAILKVLPLDDAVRAEADIYTFIVFLVIIVGMNLLFILMSFSARTKELRKLNMTSRQLETYLGSREAVTATGRDISKDSKQVVHGNPFVCFASS